MTTTTKAKTPVKKTTSKATTARVTATPSLPNNPFAFEVLDLVSRQRANSKKVELLKKYEHVSLKSIFIWNFDESVISMLPEGAVPYSGYSDQTSYSGSLTTKISEEVRKMHETGSFSLGSSDKQGHTTISREYKNFYHFIKGGNDSLNNIRRETMFINILEGLHPLEAEIICLVKDKKLSTKYNLTKEIVAEAYPDIQWGGRS
ncbi:MAG: hypothetical protein EBT80_10055 [Chitinophagales bacterium]|jgi:hypothetical protein|nr:hypothetical protein [Chitinophagales bacterium]